MSEYPPEYPPQTSRFGASWWWSLALLIGILALPLYLFTCAREGGVPRIAFEISSIKVAMESYRKEFGVFPAGDSRAICHALTGENPKKVVFIESGRRRMSPVGDLLDPWGTPYRIYLSGDEVLVRSARPNKQFEVGYAKNSDDYIQ